MDGEINDIKCQRLTENSSLHLINDGIVSWVKYVAKPQGLHYRSDEGYSREYNGYMADEMTDVQIAQAGRMK